MSGLTMGLLSLDIMSLEVLKRGGKPHQQVSTSLSLSSFVTVSFSLSPQEVLEADPTAGKEAPSTAGDSPAS